MSAAPRHMVSHSWQDPDVHPASGHVPAHPDTCVLPQEVADRAQVAQEQALKPQHMVLMLYNVKPCMVMEQEASKGPGVVGAHMAR